ncbi:MAG: cation diffusion facilitator family transporter [Bdellovibrionia bacterium]
MKISSSAQKAAIISLIVSVIVLSLKFLAYAMTKSLAVFSDATESIVNVLTASIALWIIRFAAAPADKEHPYGHGKAEYFSAVLEGGMITFAGVIIVIDAVKAVFKGVELRALESGFAVVVVAALINLGLGLYLKKIGEKQNSEALRASGTHVLSDVWTTAGVMLALVVVHLTGWTILDPIVAIIIGVALLVSGGKIIRRSISALLDEVDQESLIKITSSFANNRLRGIIDIHHLKAIRSGNFHHIDAHLVVPEYWQISEVHQLSHDFEAAVVKHYGVESEIAFHLDPCKRQYCRYCDVFDCPIRGDEFKELKKFTVESLTSGPESN